MMQQIETILQAVDHLKTEVKTQKWEWTQYF